ncbi:MAG TPA: ferrous iron transporter B [Candidatus Borkfalkia faecipullorum]|uniref:Ferrous iron transporter B n=1 Tax=Candidatus Borkfalkia faecipullorum TaxID=2838510 RepID=A0A9D2AGC5_9FIRM|nr:ferrous iron transporter B [Candidatus Borkfalkia faecipullorum]
MNILFAGNPNCGKSTLFNAVTGAHARTGNWQGVTVGALSRRAKLGKREVTFTDLPGVYSLQAYSLEEKEASAALRGSFDAAVCVADALTLPRSLALLGDILAQGTPVLLVVTMADLLRRRGGFLDEKRLSERLGIPVLLVDSHSKGDVARLRRALEEGAPRRAAPPRQDVLSGIYSAGTAEESRLEKLFYNKYFALPFFLFLLFCTFFFAFAPFMPGALCKDLLENAISALGDLLAESIRSAGAVAAGEFVRALFSGVGMLLSFLPQIFILYLALFLMEESGYLSSLAFMTDGLFSRVGLTGRAVFSVLMGFGCTATAILTTRGLENKSLQTRVVCILAYVSCSAKMPVYLTLCSAFFAHPFFAVVAVYFAGVLIAFGAALALRGGEETFILEIAHLQRPRLRVAAKSLLFSLKQFIIKIVTVVAAFLVVLWFALSFSFTFEYVGADSENSILAMLCRGLCVLFYPMGIRQWQVALAAFSGLVAKESVAGTLALFYGENLTQAMSASSAAAFLLFMMTCSPCVSAIAATAKELGLRRALQIAALQTATAFGAAYLLYALLAGGALVACIAALVLPVAAGILLKGKRHAKIHGTKKGKFKRFHR